MLYASIHIHDAILVILLRKDSYGMWDTRRVRTHLRGRIGWRLGGRASRRDRGAASRGSTQKYAYPAEHQKRAIQKRRALPPHLYNGSIDRDWELRFPCDGWSRESKLNNCVT